MSKLHSIKNIGHHRIFFVRHFNFWDVPPTTEDVHVLQVGKISMKLCHLECFFGCCSISVGCQSKSSRFQWIYPAPSLGGKSTRSWFPRQCTVMKFIEILLRAWFFCSSKCFLCSKRCSCYCVGKQLAASQKILPCWSIFQTLETSKLLPFCWGIFCVKSSHLTVAVAPWSPHASLLPPVSSQPGQWPRIAGSVARYTSVHQECHSKKPAIFWKPRWLTTWLNDELVIHSTYSSINHDQTKQTCPSLPDSRLWNHSALSFCWVSASGHVAGNPPDPGTWIKTWACSHLKNIWKHMSEPLALEMAIIQWCSSAKFLRFLYGLLVVWKWQWKSRWHVYINTSLLDRNMFQLRSNQDQKTYVIVCVIPIGSPSPLVCKFECSNSSK